MSDSDFNLQGNLSRLEDLYRKRWKFHGLSPQSLGWTKGKQDIRFDVLLGDFKCENKSFLDVGCGFGDLNITLQSRTKNYHYLGIDIMDEFIQEAHKLYGTKSIKFIQGDFSSFVTDQAFDHIIASGIFAFEFVDFDNYVYIEQTLAKMLSLCKNSVSIDFLSDNVNFRRDKTFYASPKRILDIAFNLTRSVFLRHDYMPFEFSLTLFKDDSFGEDTVFYRYKNAETDY